LNTQAQLVEAQARITELSEHVAVLNRLLFGRSSEQARPTPGPDDAKPTGQPSQPKRRGQRRGAKGHGRRDYTHLDTREEIHDVPADQRVCPTCGMEFEPLGAESAETSEQIDWQVTITRILHRRLRYRRRCACPGPRTVTAPVPPKPIPKGRFTAGFLARLLYDKYVLGRPLHRIARALAADGLDLAEGTLCGALKAVADLLAPLTEAVVAHGVQAVHAHADETSWRVFEKVDGKDGNRWWLWVFLTDDTVVFVMGPTRSAKVLERYFGVDRTAPALPEGRRLLLSTDFYAAYQALARLDGVDPLWCWAHMRRHFIRAGDAHAQLRPWRDQWVGRIADLYLAHRGLAAAEVGSPAHAQAQRDFDAALAAIDTARHEQAAMPGLHQAARKVLATLDREWDGLVRHRDFPDLELDNYAEGRIMPTSAADALVGAVVTAHSSA
jgi:transposase